MRDRNGETARFWGADIYAAGPVLIGIARRDGRGSAVSVQTAGEARGELDKLAKRQPDVIKLIFDWAGGNAG